MKKLALGLPFVLLLSIVASAQHVGLGTTTPEARLHVRSTGWVKTIFENDAGQPRGYIGTDNNGTVTLAANAFWNGSAWVYPNTGASFYMMLHRANNQFEFRVRPDGGSQNTAMVINQQGNVGIGTTSPQAPLEIGVGGNRFLRFKNDLVPTLEVVSTNSNDALAGTMRLRNVLEIWPNSGGTQAGKMDVRNAAGNATITLNGSTGIVQANAIEASSVNATSLIASGGIAGQSVFAPNLPGYFCKPCSLRLVLKRDADPPLNIVICEVDVELAAAGVLVLEGGSEAWLNEGSALPGETQGILEYKLDEYSTANSYISTLVKRTFTSHPVSDPTIRAHLAFNTPVTKRFKLVLYKKDVATGNTIFGNHFIRGWYYPNWMNAQ